MRKCLAASGSRWAAATAVSAVVTRPYCASVEWSPSAVSQGGSCITGGLLFNRWRVPTSLGAAWPDPKNAMPQPPNNAVATRNKWRVTKGKAMPAVTIVDRAITPAVEKTAVDEGLVKPASRLKEGAKRRNAPTTQRRIQLPVVAGRTSPPRHVPKVHGAQKERRMSEPAGTQLDRARTKRSGHSGAAPKRVAGQPAGEGGARIVLCRVCRLCHKP